MKCFKAALAYLRLAHTSKRHELQAIDSWAKHATKFANNAPGVEYCQTCASRVAVHNWARVINLAEK